MWVWSLGLGSWFWGGLRGSIWDSLHPGWGLPALHPAPMDSPKGPCTQIVYTWAPKYPNRDYFKAKVYLLGYMDPSIQALGGRPRANCRIRPKSRSLNPTAKRAYRSKP